MAQEGGYGIELVAHNEESFFNKSKISAYRILEGKSGPLYRGDIKIVH